MNDQEFKRRTKQPALKMIEMIIELPPGKASDGVARQLLRSGTSVGANLKSKS